MKLNVLAHTSYVGRGGINAHFSHLYRELSAHHNVNVRNYTISDGWKGLNHRPHDNEPNIDDLDRKLLRLQTLWTDGKRMDYPIYGNITEPIHVNIVSDLADHYYYYDQYPTPKIGFALWESTKLPDNFFQKLKTFDEVWTPSEWQKECMVKQGMPEDSIKVVPGGVEANVFYAEDVSFDEYYGDGRFKFVVFGRWDYRKSTTEIIQTFLNTFDKKEPVDLIISVDNAHAKDGLKTTEERLKQNHFDDPRIKVVHFPKRADYIKFIKKGHVFLSCSRGEGINLPLMEAIASGTPAIYSKCTGQLQFTDGVGHPVSIRGTCPSDLGDSGTYSQPDFADLSKVMRDVYTNYADYKKKALNLAPNFRRKHDWKRVGKIAADTLDAFYARRTQPVNATKDRLKVLLVVPHLSTGGMPQFAVKRVEALKDECDVYCVEYEQIAYDYIVQREKMKQLLGDKFWSLQDKPKEGLLDLIDQIKPDVVHFEEFSDTFLSRPIAEKVFRKSRPYLIFESNHGLWFAASDKVYFPDKLLLISEFQADLYRSLNIPIDIIPYPIEDHTPRKAQCQAELGFEPDYKHVINVGLFTPGKNQGELIGYARQMLNEKVKFHFIGNQAGNFQGYWEPLMKDLPSNCKIWGERSDVDKFYQAADLMVFTSIMETSPIVIREAIAWKLPTLIHKLPAYRGMYDKYSFVKYLTDGDSETNLSLIRSEPISPLETVTVVLSHANSEKRRNILKGCAANIKGPKILSSNFKDDDEVRSWFDYVVFDPENPILWQSEYAEHDAYFSKFVNGVESPCECNHGYAVYQLVRQGVELANRLGYKKVHVVNYDYDISPATYQQHRASLDKHDCVVYHYPVKGYAEPSFCTGFFSGRTDTLLKAFQFYNSKKDYYLHPTVPIYFVILEVQLYYLLNQQNALLNVLSYEDLKQTDRVDLETF